MQKKKVAESLRIESKAKKKREKNSSNSRKCKFLMTQNQGAKGFRAKIVG
jgi:hypothetical protein